jgi:KaiC/GvpD/RAD55 family RecA-like ATPase
VPRIPLIEDLTKGPIPAGSNILVEFDPASQWYNASVTIIAGWLKTGGRARYTLSTQPPDDFRSQLNRYVQNVSELESKDILQIWDLYSVTLGQKSKEKYTIDSLKVADMSIQYATQMMRQPIALDILLIGDDETVAARFNDEKNWVEFTLTRDFPNVKLRKLSGISGLLRGVLGDWAQKRLEGAADGIIDFKVEEAGNVTRDLIRIRSMRGVGFDREWHELKISENLEVSLQS